MSLSGFLSSKKDPNKRANSPPNCHLIHYLSAAFCTENEKKREKDRLASMFSHTRRLISTPFCPYLILFLVETAHFWVWLGMCRNDRPTASPSWRIFKSLLWHRREDDVATAVSHDDAHNEGFQSDTWRDHCSRHLCLFYTSVWCCFSIGHENIDYHDYR